MDNAVSSENKSNLSRVVYLDYVRVFATLAVVFIHITSLRWWEADVNGAEFRIYNFYNSISRWGVDAFILISGALFLTKTIPVKKLYTKYITRMVTAYVFWCLVYYLAGGDGFASQCKALWEGDTFALILDILKGYYHMWFIPMIIGLYISYPILKRISEDRKIMKYFLIVQLLFLYLRGLFLQLSVLVDSEVFKKFVGDAETIITSMNLDIFLGYSSIFLLGYIIATSEISKKTRYLIYLLAVFSLTVTIVLTRWVSIKYQTPYELFFVDLAWNIVAISSAVMVFFKNCRFTNRRINNIFRIMSKYCFGVYLCHVLIIEKSLNYIMIMIQKPLILIPIVTVVVFFMAYVISYILNHVPLLKKYIV